jgi:hypothetical protein
VHVRREGTSCRARVSCGARTAHARALSACPHYHRRRLARSYTAPT